MNVFDLEFEHQWIQFHSQSKLVETKLIENSYRLSDRLSDGRNLEQSVISRFISWEYPWRFILKGTLKEICNQNFWIRLKLTDYMIKSRSNFMTIWITQNRIKMTSMVFKVFFSWILSSPPEIDGNRCRVPACSRSPR